MQERAKSTCLTASAATFSNRTRKTLCGAKRQIREPTGVAGQARNSVRRIRSGSERTRNAALIPQFFAWCAAAQRHGCCGREHFRRQFAVESEGLETEGELIVLARIARHTERRARLAVVPKPRHTCPRC